MMKLVFMGTPEYAATILDELLGQHEVVAVYTRPDAVRGRGSAVVGSPVKQLAQQHGIAVHTPTTLKDPAEWERLEAYAPDAIVVAAYGMILPKQVLDIPRLGCVNAHASLLPRWRGAAPVERAILAGDRIAGVCAMRMEEGLDTGAFCVSRSMEIGRLNATELTDELASLGAEAILSALAQLEAGRPFWNEQVEADVTYAEKIGKQELFLSGGDSAEMADRKVRAASEAHPCKCVVAEKSVSLLKAQPVPAEASLDIPPGQVLYMAKRLYLGCSDGALEVLALKPDGKKEMDAKSFAAGIQNIKNGSFTWRSSGD